MPLAPGQSLQHFRLVDKIGEGGMGEVWRAIDTTLDREVAIKVLSPAFSGDPDRIVRLEREAKLLASLNHPNIAAIYGFPGEGTHARFLAMELVRGPDLAEILTRGPMPIREALEAAKQVAAALEAAHDNGVVHRDLKPANVKRTPEGQIKVLDFGLAKALETAAPVSERSATVTSAGSVAGMILGTASYMSPEQARGLPVDRRCDLWAFGCLLFEMLTGARAFDGPTVTDVLAAVVTGEPDWGKLPAATPPTVRRLLRRCLEKDLRKRLRDAGDASLLLEDNPEDAKAAPASTAGPVPRTRPTILVAVAFAAAIAGTAAGFWLAHRGTTRTPAAAPNVAFRRLTFGRGMLRAARFAPDGQTIVYGAAWNGPPVKLYLGRVDTQDATAIGVPPGELLSVSRTGEMAVSLGHSYLGWMGEGTLSRTSLLGGSPRELLEHVRVADWSPDGSQFAIVRRVEGFDRLEYPVGTVLHRNAGYISDVRISPDGERVAFADHPVYADDRGDLAVVDRSGHKTTLQTGFDAMHGIAWAPGGKEVWFAAMRASTGFQLSACDLSGNARVVHPSMTGLELFDIAADGRVLLGQQISIRQSQAMLLGDTQPRDLIVPGESSMTRAVTADGRVALVTDQSSQEYETFLVRADRPGATHLSTGDGNAISADGKWALAVSPDVRTIYLSPVGAGTTRAIPNPGGVAYEGLPAWLPDSKRFVVVVRRGNDASRAVVCDAASGALEEFGAPGVTWNFFNGPPVSPDGRFVVLQDPNQVPKRWPVDGGDPLPIPGLGSGDVPLAWSDDGTALYVGGPTVPIPIVRVDLETGRRTAWMTIAPTDTAGLRFAAVTMAPNGKFWTLSVSRLFTDLYVVEGLR